MQTPLTKPRRGWLKWVIGMALLPLLIFAGYLAFVLNWSYSDGERAGYLQKFSRKGWVCKTYEGELAMTTVPGVAPVLWNFTVRDEAVAARLNTLLGKRIVLHYEEHRGIPTSCYGETNHFVDRVQVIAEPDYGEANHFVDRAQEVAEFDAATLSPGIVSGALRP